MNGKQLKNSILQWAIQGKLVPPVCRQAGKTLMTNPVPRDKGKECWFTYVIECEDGSFYKGFTDNLLRRYQQHCNGTGADYTKTHKPKQLYYWEMHYSKEAALQREKYLKSGAGREWFKKEVVDKPENFEPASVLLDKIRQEKERLIKEKKIKRDKNASIIYRGEDNSYYEKILATGEVKCIDEEVPFEIPKGWEWCRLRDIIIFIGGYAYDSHSFLEKSEYQVLRLGNIKNDTINKSVNPVFIDEILAQDTVRFRCLKNDILVTMTGTRKKRDYFYTVLIDTDHSNMYFNQRVGCLRAIYSPIALWLNKVLKAETILHQVFQYETGTANQGNLGASNIMNTLIPLPPVTEQFRIVKKLEEVHTYVFQYDKAQCELDILNFGIRNTIKKSLVQEAIQGKLVPQITEEGTAQELLEQIKEEKLKLVKEGKLKKSALKDSVIFKGDDNKYWEKNGESEYCIDNIVPFELPPTWCWVRHNQLFEISGGSQPPKSQFIERPQEGYIRLYQIRDYGNSPLPVFIPKEKASKITKKGDIILARYGASLGKVFFAEDGAYNVAMAKVIPQFPEILICKEFLFLFYKTSIYQKLVKDRSRCAQAGFNKEDLNDLLFPLPPLKEQHRIVERFKNVTSIMSR